MLLQVPNVDTFADSSSGVGVGVLRSPRIGSASSHLFVGLREQRHRTVFAKER